MKKQTIIVLFVMAMVLSLTAVVSAADKNQKYFDTIDGDLLKIYSAVVNDDFEEARKVIPTLRQNIYECSRYLLEKGQYSSNLMDIVTLVNNAVQNENKNTPEIVVSARCSLARILLKTTPDFCYNPDALADVHKREPELASDSSHS